MTILKLDISYHQRDYDIPFLELFDWGFRVVSVKASMGYGQDAECMRRSAEVIRAENLVLELYHWVDPTTDGARQVRRWFVPLVREWMPDAVALDQEQVHPWRADGKRLDYSRALPAKQILKAAKTATAELAKPEYKSFMPPSHRRQQYTGGWVLRYCPQLDDFIADQPAWWAQYHDYGIAWYRDGKMRADPYTVSPEDLLAIAERCREVAAPPAVTNVLWRQFGSRFVIDGVQGGPLDVSVWMGTDAEFKEWSGGQ